MESESSMHKMYIVLGDWSDDGHGKSEKVLIETNVSVEELRAAYLRSVETTGLNFSKEVAANYEDNTAPIYRLRDLGCPELILNELIEENYGGSLEDAIDDGDLTVDEEPVGAFTCDTYVATLMWFISLSLPDLQWIPLDDTIPFFNGYWGLLNVSFGYGLYY